MINMDLNEIRGKIKMYPETWIHIYTTNCYAYALGLDIKENNICQYAYQPGTISNTSNVANSEYFSKKELLNGLKGDLKALGISYRRVDSSDQINDDEWKIALMLSKSCQEFADFHFLRQKKNEIWFHKNGFGGCISKKDYLGKIITNPETAYLPTYEFDRCYALKLNK